MTVGAHPMERNRFTSQSVDSDKLRRAMARGRKHTANIGELVSVGVRRGDEFQLPKGLVVAPASGTQPFGHPNGSRPPTPDLECDAKGPE